MTAIADRLKRKEGNSDMSATNTEVTELSDNHHIPNAQLRVCPDAGHGFLNRYPELFADHVNAFLNGG